jgi:hypothetical protein
MILELWYLWYAYPGIYKHYFDYIKDSVALVKEVGATFGLQVMLDDDQWNDAAIDQLQQKYPISNTTAAGG